MKILLLGKNGQVGSELQRALTPLGEVIACDRSEADLEDLSGLSRLVRSVQPGVIVNAAAYTAVDRAESEPARAMRINAEAVGVLAAETRRSEGLLVHYSTDYVFDGRKDGDYLETDATAPLSVYGASKLAGERAITASGCRHLIFRTSWVFAARGANFIHTMLRLGRERDEIKVVADQTGAPTSAELIADVTAMALRGLEEQAQQTAGAATAVPLNGIYHLAAAGATSWHGYAQLAVQEALRVGIELRVTPERVIPITSAEYPALAGRPRNSRLDTGKLRSALGIAMPPWELHVKRWLEKQLMATTK